MDRPAMSDPSHHAPIEVRSGDSWAIPGTLIDIGGGPLDLTDAVLEWTLLGPDGLVALPPGSATITVLGDPEDGQLVISLEPGVTAPLESGTYSDALRITVAGGARITMWVGVVAVDPDAFDDQPAGP
jgi:hypothetical protein